jgi:hypothetical protein
VNIAAYLVAALTALLAGRGAAHPFLDGDLFWQRELGASIVAHHALPTTLGPSVFTVPNAAWVPQEWLFGLAVFAATNAHALWALVVAAAAALAFAVLVGTARATGAGSAARTIVAALAVIGVSGSFGARAQVFAWPCLAALLYTLDLDGWRILWTFPVVVLWSNLHASSLLAVPIVWLDAATCIALRGTGAAESRQRVVLALAIPFATLLTPLGLKVPLLAIAWMESPARQFITEWQPITRAPFDASFLLAALPLALLIAMSARSLVRERARDLAVCALFAVMMCSSVRNMPLFLIAAVAPASVALEALLVRLNLFRWLESDRMPNSPWTIALVAPIVAIGFLVGIHSTTARAVYEPPYAAMNALSATAGRHRLFCAEFEDCSLAAGTSTTVFMDGRTDAYPITIWRDYETIGNAGDGWRALLDTWQVDAVTVRPADRLYDALAAQPDWRIAYAGASGRLYLRR